MPSDAEMFGSNTATQESLTGDDADTQALSVVRARRMFSDAYKAQQDWRSSVVENLKMLNNDQWSDELKAKLQEQNMAPIVINKMLMPLMFLSGVQRQTRQEPKLLPFESGDLQAAHVMNVLYHWVENQNKAEDVDSRVFLDKVGVGLGWWKVTMDFDGEDIEGDIRIRRRHLLSVFPDPNFFDNDWEDAEYVVDAQWYTPREAQERWPEHADAFTRQGGEWLRITEGDNAGAAGLAEHTGDSLANQRLFWDPETKRVRIAEVWYKQRQKVTVALNLQTMEAMEDQERVMRLKQMLTALTPGEQQNIQFIERTATLYRVAHLFHDTMLDDFTSPYDAPSFPLFPTVGFYFWKQPFGLADLMKDLQFEKNKRRSKIIDLVGRMPLSGFFYKNSETTTAKQIEEYGAGNGVGIGYDQEKPDQIRPPDLPMALVRLEDKSDEEIKDVPNVHNELLGQATQKTISGRAIEARQRGGLISHEHLFDSFRKDKEMLVRFIVRMIQQYMSPTKALRILGTMAARQPDSAMGQMMQAAPTDGGQAVMAALSSAFDARYDVVISSRPTEPSLAMQAWETLTELAQAKMPIPPKVLFDAAQKAGVLGEDQVQEILAFLQQQQEPPQTAPPHGAAPGGPLPTPATATA